MNTYKILSVVLFFAATVFFTVSRAAPSAQLINDDNFPNLSMGLPVIRAALSFNRNGENVANDNANLRGGPLISAIDVLTGRKKRQAADNDEGGPILGLIGSLFPRGALCLLALHLAMSKVHLFAKI